MLNLDRSDRIGWQGLSVRLYRTRFPGHTFVLCRLA